MTISYCRRNPTSFFYLRLTTLTASKASLFSLSSYRLLISTEGQAAKSRIEIKPSVLKIFLYRFVVQYLAICRTFKYDKILSQHYDNSYSIILFNLLKLNLSFMYFRITKKRQNFVTCDKVLSYLNVRHNHIVRWVLPAYDFSPPVPCFHCHG